MGRIAGLRQRVGRLSLAVKVYIGLAALAAGLLLIGSITTYASLSTQRLVSRTLARQRKLTDLTANINNTLLDIQNRALQFYDSWMLHGFERGVTHAGFDYARKTYVIPIQDQLQQVRYDIDAMRQLKADAETRTALEKIRTNVDAYETTILAMSDQMERLGYRTSGEMGQIYSAIDELTSSIDAASLGHLQVLLGQSVQFLNDYFLKSDLASARLAREFIQQLQHQIETTEDTQLASLDRAALLSLLERYDNHFLEAMSQKQKLQNTRPDLVSQSALAGVLVTELLEQQQAEFNTTVEQLQGHLSAAMITTVGVVLLAMLGAPVLAFMVTRQIIQPIRLLGESAKQLGAGDFSVRAQTKSRDEIGTTARAFNQMADQLEQLLTSLERRVADRTHDLQKTTEELMARSAELEEAHQRQIAINHRLQEVISQSQHRATLLEASARVSRAAARIRDLNALLRQVTQLISHHFGYYHVGIFLIDEAGRYAVLRAANSEGGQRMLARGHKLEVGTTGIVGHVTSTGQPRIALDIGNDAYFFDNPDLPNTRSELALPLRIGDEVIGAVDVQSREQAAFDQEDIAVLTALADQVTIAIENARLFQQSQLALEEVERAHRRYLRKQWSEFTQTESQLVYEYSPSGASTLDRIPISEADTVWREGQRISDDVTDRGRWPREDNGAANIPLTLAVPIEIRGEIIGVLELQEMANDRLWTSDEIALVETVAKQLGQTLEEARLFEQTQASLAETRTLFQTSRNLAAAHETREIWQTVINSAQQRGADACALLIFDAGDRNRARELVVVAGWDRHRHSPRLRAGMRLPLDRFDLFSTLSSDQPFVVNNLAQAKNVDGQTRAWLDHIGFSALVHQPLAVRQRWFGLLTVFYESPHTFTETETDFYRALADQASLAMESQRLLIDTQRRAEREQLIRQITDRVRATSDLETILQTTVQELSKAMGFPRAFIRLGTEDELLAGSGRLVHRQGGSTP